MKHVKIAISFSLLISALAYGTNATNAVSPHLSFRPQGQDLALQKVGTTKLEYKSDADVHNGVLTITPKYTQSFHNDAITRSYLVHFFSNHAID